MNASNDVLERGSVPVMGWGSWGVRRLKRPWKSVLDPGDPVGWDKAYCRVHIRVFVPLPQLSLTIKAQPARFWNPLDTLRHQRANLSGDFGKDGKRVWRVSLMRHRKLRPRQSDSQGRRNSTKKGPVIVAKTM